eukprot:jgi/Bigna1/81983/fgenesh1_pg.86_\
MASGPSTSTNVAEKKMSIAPDSAISPTTSSIYLCAIVVGAIAFGKQNIEIPSLTGPPAATKPYDSFSEFYTFYSSEHQNPTCRLLHVIGTGLITVLLVNSQTAEPSLLPSLGIAAMSGYIACKALVGVEHGFFEFGIALASLICATKAKNALSTSRVLCCS